ncbi:succinylglutamate desuccinylase/aspartoacylase family protein [Arenimonas sp. GDDSR-1]|uniref:M14 family metallopeptidase n=1 Tax=Arenimonas sp. GDDSR-1 TaxID=2950125 RepID=UPI00261477C4|nr:succinylglutamate desuccinylase/aspartoacylase family protein [Arenimonas sp. GDDSR-1]
MKRLCASILLCFMASCACAATGYTGDTVDGVKVIRTLDLADLEGGKIHRFYLQGASNGVGQHWLVPVLVAKGSKPGKRLGLQAGVHGDELNGTRLIHRVFETLDPAALSGSVIAVIGANSTGLLANSRYFQLQHDSGGGVDFNRIWPGKADGNAAEQQVHRIFNGIWAGNADAVIDLHTQSTGTAYPLYIYADYRVAGVKALAEMIPADIIKIDPGEPGAAEQAFNDAGMVSITLEIGAAKVYQPELIARALVGIDNVLKNYGMLPGKPGRDAKAQHSFIGNQTQSIRAGGGGFTEVLVALNQDVKAGQLLAVQRNGFGDITARYSAPFDARVASIGTDPLREPGSLLVRLIRINTDAACSDGC